MRKLEKEDESEKTPAPFTVNRIDDRLALTSDNPSVRNVAATYCREYLDLFGEVTQYDESLLLSGIDGDMFTLIRHKILNLIEVVRLVGADVQDRKHPDVAIVRFGPDSSGLAKLLFEDRKIYLSYDALPRDSNGLYLAYVWIPASYRSETYNVLFNILAIAGGSPGPIQCTLQGQVHGDIRGS